MPDVQKNFIEPLLTQFRVPADIKPEHVPGFFNDYAEALVYCNRDGELVAYDDQVLIAAARKLKAEKTGSRTFPLPAECIEACQQVRGQMHAAQMHAEKHEKDAEWSPARRQFADSCMPSQMGRQSVDEGWSWAFWDFCRENTRMPNFIEMTAIRAKSLANSAELQETLAKPGANTPMMRKWLALRVANLSRLKGMAYA